MCMWPITSANHVYVTNNISFDSVHTAERNVKQAVWTRVELKPFIWIRFTTLWGGRRKCRDGAISLKAYLWSLQCLHWTYSINCDTASSKVRAFVILAFRGAELLWRKLLREWVCVYTGCTAPTYHQPIISMRSYTEPSELWSFLGWARRCGTELDLAPATASPPPNCIAGSSISTSPHCNREKLVCDWFLFQSAKPTHHHMAPSSTSP